MGRIIFREQVSFRILWVLWGLLNFSILNAKKITISGKQTTFIPNFYSQSNQTYRVPFKNELGQKCSSVPVLKKFEVKDNSIPCHCPAWWCGTSYDFTYQSSVYPLLNTIDKDQMNVFTKNSCYWGRSLSPSGLYTIDYEIECELEEKVEPLVQIPSDINLKKKHFKTIWFEPGVDEHRYVDFQEIYDYFSKLKKLGVERLVLAYSYGDWDHCYYYEPQNTLKFNAHHLDENKNLLTYYVDASNPKASCAGYDSKKNLLKFTFKAADLLGLKVVVGLSRTGDVELLNDIYRANNGYKSSMYLQSDVNQRLSYAVSFSNAMATDLWNQFGKHSSFEGWYLTHETHCMEIGSLYYKPVATHLKSLSKKLVMISPTIDAQICSSGGSLSEYSSFLSNHKGLIDLYSYQDTLGAGTLWVNGSSKYYYTDTARAQRLYELHLGSSGVAYSGLLASLHFAHKQTSTDYQINVEGWRMSGPSYGNAYAGTWDSIKKQLEIYSLYTNNLMLNEGFLLFNFNHPNLTFDSTDLRSKTSKAFTLDYINYLRE